MAGFDPMPGLLPTRQDAQPLVWWTAAQLDALCGRLAQTWSEWAGDWVPHAVGGDAEAAQAHERPDSERASWVPLGRRGEAAAWVQVRTDPVSDVFATLFAADAVPAGSVSREDGIGQAVASRAWDALADALRGILALASDAGQAEPAAASFKPWSGCVLVSLTGAGRLPRALLLNPACVRAALGPQGEGPVADRSRCKTPGALVPLAHALADRKLALRIELSSCELDLGSLEGLRIGDIVPLPHSLEVPLTVSTAQDVHVCAGFLGRQGIHKAIELARDTAADREAQTDHHL